MDNPKSPTSLQNPQIPVCAFNEPYWVDYENKIIHCHQSFVNLYNIMIDISENFGIEKDKSILCFNLMSRFPFCFDLKKETCEKTVKQYKVFVDDRFTHVKYWSSN